jgi:hypothetical protein
MHRFILGLRQGDPDVDHINRNGFDNRKVNLRLATQVTNQHNAKLRVDNTSGYKGISWYKSIGKWVARIRVVGGKQRFLGSYYSRLKAHNVYQKALREICKGGVK